MTKTVVYKDGKVLFQITEEVLNDFYSQGLPNGQIAISQVYSGEIHEGQELYFNFETENFEVR